MRRRMGEYVALSLAQVEALHYISERGMPLMRDLAGHLRIKAPSATALAAELVRAGLVKRTAGTGDRRQVSLALTAKGAQTLKETVARKREVIAEVLSPLSAGDRREFDRILERIIKANN